MSKVLSLSARNICRLQQIDFNLEGRHLYVVGGKNGNGKTSALTALLCVVAGRSGMDNYPDVLLRQGETEGVSVVKLTGVETFDELTATLKLSRQRGGTVIEDLTLTDASGKKVKEPRTILKSLFEMRGFDPLAFERSKPVERKAMLERLLGLDFADELKRRAELFEERTGVNRDVKAAKARLDGQPSYPAVEEMSVAELLADISAKDVVNAENSNRREFVVSLERDLVTANDKVTETKAEIERLQKKLEMQRLLLPIWRPRFWSTRWL